MSNFSSIEDIIAWQEARQLVNEIYTLTKIDKIKGDYSLVNQIRRASISVMANIAEGYGRKSFAEFSQFLNISHGSLIEVISHLYIFLDQKYIAQEQFNYLHFHYMKLSKMIMSLKSYLNENKNKNKKELKN